MRITSSFVSRRNASKSGPAHGTTTSSLDPRLPPPSFEPPAALEDGALRVPPRTCRATTSTRTCSGAAYNSTRIGAVYSSTRITAARALQQASTRGAESSGERALCGQGCRDRAAEQHCVRHTGTGQRCTAQRSRALCEALLRTMRLTSAKEISPEPSVSNCLKSSATSSRGTSLKPISGSNPLRITRVASACVMRSISKGSNAEASITGTGTGTGHVTESIYVERTRVALVDATRGINR